MNETGIIMSGSHPRDILEGRKTMTRRVVTKHNSVIGEGGDWAKFDWKGETVLSKQLQEILSSDYRTGSLAESVIQNSYKAPYPWVDHSYSNYQYLHVPYDWAENGTIYRIYPKWDVGDRLWLKETWAPIHQGTCFTYKADYPAPASFPSLQWKSPIFMPRWASRILLEITDVRVERLTEITPSDVTAEGVDNLVTFMLLWDRLNRKRGYEWESNCWVWVITFKLCR